MDNQGITELAHELAKLDGFPLGQWHPDAWLVLQDYEAFRARYRVRAEALASTYAIRRIQAEAWDEGYWLGINRHTGPGNPYRPTGEISTGADQ